MLLLLLADATAVQAKREPIRVFVLDETKSGEWVDPGVQDRLDSAHDLVRSLDLKKGIEIVTDAAEAHVTVRVTGRVEGDTSTTGGTVGWSPVVLKKHQGNQSPP